MDEPKFCKDCKHFSRSVPVKFSKCGAFRDPVTGGPGEFADLQRKYRFSDHCGPDGKHFEPRKPGWGHPIMLLAYAVVALFVGLLAWAIFG